MRVIEQAFLLVLTESLECVLLSDKIVFNVSLNVAWLVFVSQDIPIVSHVEHIFNTCFSIFRRILRLLHNKLCTSKLYC